MAAINIRLDDELKKEFEAFCSNVGMNMTTAFSIFASTVVREQRIPFEISTETFYNQKNINQLIKAKQDLENARGKVHELIED